MPEVYDLRLVALSIIVAIGASYTALNLAGRVTQASGLAAMWWLAGGAISMGLGIWSMHFVGMLALKLPIAIAYDLPMTGLSLLIAISISAFALHLVSGSSLGRMRLATGGLALGGGISLMHYSGMAAIEVAPGIHYDPLMFAASITVALVAAVAALWIAFRLRTEGSGIVTMQRLGAALIMGAAISGMHFTGMAAAHFAPGAICTAPASELDQSWLAITVAISTLAALAIAVLASVFDAHLISRTQKLVGSLREANQELTHLATHDTLTGLPNRALLSDRIERAIDDAENGADPFAVLFVDLDRFKVINDSLGHHVGDELLRQVASRIQSVIARGDTLARLGGDEFVLLLRQPRLPASAAETARLLQKALATIFSIDGHELHLTSTIGIGVYPDDGCTVNELLVNADAAMYHAKQAGRDAFQFFASGMNAFAQERLELENGLRRALVKDEFELHYQPKVDIATGSITSMEALVRWRHPTRGLVPPDVFIPVAEETGLIGKLGEWVLRTACRQNRAWQDAGLPPMRIAVNLSAKQFKQTDLLGFVTGLLKETNLAAEFLELELTESTVMQQPEESVKILESLSRIGVHIAIDDFGTGYSSLAYLRRLPLNKLKVDRSFIHHLTQNADDASIVQAVISLAHSLRLEVIAEGVETAEQLSLLKAFGCDQFQGFYFSPPVRAEDAAKLLEVSSIPAFLPHAIVSLADMIDDHLPIPV